MKTKPLEEKLKKMNEGVLSVELVEAPESKLPVPVEELVEEISDGPEDEFHKELSYLCKLAGRDGGYISKIEDKLESLLDIHNFLDKDHYHKRIREDEGFIDYLFLKEFAGKTGTYGLTLDIKESQKFENLLGDYMSVVKNRKEDNYGGFGAMIGLIPAIGIGITVGMYVEPAIGGFSFLVGIGTIGSTLASSGVAGSWLGRRNLRNTSKKLHDALQEYGQEGKVKSSQDKYEFGIIKHYLGLTPKWLL